MTYFCRPKFGNEMHFIPSRSIILKTMYFLMSVEYKIEYSNSNFQEKILFFIQGTRVM